MRTLLGGSAASSAVTYATKILEAYTGNVYAEEGRGFERLSQTEANRMIELCEVHGMKQESVARAMGRHARTVSEVVGRRHELSRNIPKRGRK